MTDERQYSALEAATAWAPDALGTDVGFDTDVIASFSGEWDEVSGIACLVQDLVHRLQTPRGSYVLHPEYGSLVHEFLHTRMDAFGQRALAIEVRETFESDPRVEAAEVQLTVDDGGHVSARISLQVVERANPLNLVFGWDLARPSLVEVTSG